jgi:hypothetical protein
VSFVVIMFVFAYAGLSARVLSLEKVKKVVQAVMGI